MSIAQPGVPLPKRASVLTLAVRNLMHDLCDRREEGKPAGPPPSLAAGSLRLSSALDAAIRRGAQRVTALRVRPGL
jgi:hypothetical protein